MSASPRHQIALLSDGVFTETWSSMSSTVVTPRLDRIAPHETLLVHTPVKFGGLVLAAQTLLATIIAAKLKSLLVLVVDLAMLSLAIRFRSTPD